MKKTISLITLSMILLASKVNAGSTLENPLKAGSVPGLIGIVIKALLGMTGSIALLMFIYGGFMWLTSGGDKGKIDTGKKTIIYSVLGIVVIFTAYAVIKLVFSIFAE